MFLAGNFPSWQSYQNKRNFERPYVLSLIQMKERERWLFAGLFSVEGPCVRERDHHGGGGQSWVYPMTEVEQSSQLTGRLVANFTSPGRAPYLNAEKWVVAVTLARSIRNVS